MDPGGNTPALKGFDLEKTHRSGNGPLAPTSHMALPDCPGSGRHGEICGYSARNRSIHHAVEKQSTEKDHQLLTRNSIPSHHGEVSMDFYGSTEEDANYQET